MRSKGLVLTFAILAGFFVCSTVATAQDPAPAGEPAAASEESGSEAAKRKTPFALFVKAGWGSSTADTVNTSIQTSSTSTSENLLDLDKIDHGRVEIGWKLPFQKGDFRVVFNGFKESEYKFSAIGRQATTNPATTPTTPSLVPKNLVWWTVNIDNGTFASNRTPPAWDISTDDVNGNSLAEPNEVRYGAPDISTTRSVSDSLQNQIQSVDFLYGRKWGKRRYSARWWGGMRYFKYEGNLPAAAWLAASRAGLGFTDGSLVRLLNYTTQAEGIGPSGILEADFNFFDSRMTLFFQAQAAFLVTNLESDTGGFFTFVFPDTPEALPVQGRLMDDRSKSTWQDSAEIGGRWLTKKGVEFEIAYGIYGYLDVILSPTQIRIPTSPSQGSLGSSALYNTQDLVLDGWRAAVSYQF